MILPSLTQSIFNHLSHLLYTHIHTHKLTVICFLRSNDFSPSSSSSSTHYFVYFFLLSLEVFSHMNKLLFRTDNSNNNNNGLSQSSAFNINIMIFWCFMILIGTRPMYIIFTCFCSTLAPNISRLCINLPMLAFSPSSPFFFFYSSCSFFVVVIVHFVTSHSCYF